MVADSLSAAPWTVANVGPRRLRVWLPAEMAIDLADHLLGGECPDDWIEFGQALLDAAVRDGALIKGEWDGG